ncbi:MAG: hypothetical protein WC124_02060 [Desulfoplanes sp.]
MKIVIIALLLISMCSGFDLPACHDYQKIEEVQSLVDRYHFRYAWQNDTFDCADMAAANWRFLKSEGYDPLIAICDYPGGGGHCYVIFPLSDGWAGLDTRTALLQGRSLNDSLGQVVTDLPGYRLLKTDQDLYEYDPRGQPKITGEVIARNPSLPPLFL